MKKMLMILFSSVFVFALEFSQIESQMQKNINKSLEILQKTSDKGLAAEQIFELFDEVFDFDLMAKLSLSKNFKKLNETQQNAYISLFKENLKKSFTDKLGLYKNEKLLIKDGKKSANNRYFLHSIMQIDGEEKQIIFKFYENNADFRIYDVDILGISIVQTYRSQFGDMLENQGFDALMQKLSQTTIK